MTEFPAAALDATEAIPTSGRRSIPPTAISGESDQPEEPPSYDSWFAKYSSITTRLILNADRDLLERVETEKIIGGVDDRLPVKSISDFPYCGICFLKCWPAHRRNSYLGTGWLVAPNLLFTAGHNVHSREDGGYMGQVEVFFLYNGGGFEKRIVVPRSNLRTTTAWEQSNPAGPQDIAAIILPESVGTRYGSIGYEPLSADQVRGKNVTLAGYPGKPPKSASNGMMVSHERTVTGTRTNQLIYSADTSPGQSGCPVLTKLPNDQWISIGIHNYGDASGNLCTWITDPVYQLLEQWQEEAAGVSRG